MKDLKLSSGLAGGGIGLVLIALFYLGERLWRLPFLPFDFFDWLARALPGDLITLGIDVIVGVVLAFDIGRSTSATAKFIEQLLALFLFVFLWAVLGGVVAAAGRRSRLTPDQAGAAAGFALGLGGVGISSALGNGPGIAGGAWLIALPLGGGWALGRVLAAAPPEGEPAGRRSFFLRFGGAVLGLALAGWGIGRWFGLEPEETGAGRAIAPGEGGSPPMADVATAPAELQGRLEPAPGTRLELTPEGEFYRIDINTRPPVIDSETWVLHVEGLFDNPRQLTLADLMAFPAVTQPITLSCISNRIAGDLISTAEWTGVRLGLLLEELGLQPEARELFIEAEDGFYESVAMADMMDPRTLLVYAMNGETLPQRHGFPLRIYRKSP